jgi:hypothetical protein
MQKVAARHAPSPARTTARQERGAALSSPFGEQAAEFAALVNDNPAMTVQRRLVESIHGSPLVRAQREALDELFRGTAQRTGAEALGADRAGADTVGGLPRAQFLELLRERIRGIADEVLAGLDQSADNCPYIAYWFDYYAGKDAEHVLLAINKYAPETKGMGAADLLIEAVVKKVRSSFEQHVRTGSLEGVPEELPSDLHQTAEEKQAAPAQPAATSAVVQLCGNAEQDAPTDDAVALGNKLKTFRKSTSGGATASRPDEFLDADAEFDTLGNRLIAGDYAVASIGAPLLYTLGIVEAYLAQDIVNGDPPAKVTRRNNYRTWRAQLLAHVSPQVLRRWTSSMKAQVPAMPNATHTPAKYLGEDRVEATQQGGARIGINEMGPLSALKRNDYARINAAYRATEDQDKAGLLDGGLAIANYRKKGGQLVPSPWRMDRESDCLLGGGTADNVHVGDVHTEQGFAFFGGNAKSIKGKRYHLKVQLTSAIAYISYMFGGNHESDWEYVTMPGSRFALDEIEAENNIYRYTQLS